MYECCTAKVTPCSLCIELEDTDGLQSLASTLCSSLVLETPVMSGKANTGRLLEQYQAISYLVRQQDEVLAEIFLAAEGGKWLWLPSAFQPKHKQ
jgi:hypothetical protein